MILYRYVISILGRAEKGSRFFNELLQQRRIFNEAKNGNYSYFPNTIANDDDVICEAAVGMSIKSLKCKTH